MIRFIIILIAAVSAFSSLVFAEEATEENTSTPAPDPRVEAILDAADLKYDVDDEQDFELLFEFEEDSRSQTVWVKSVTYFNGDVEMREVWSYGYKHPTKRMPPDVLTRALRDSYDRIMGAWAIQENYLIYLVKIPGDANAILLQQAISEAAAVADEMEEAISGEDVY